MPQSVASVEAEPSKLLKLAQLRQSHQKPTKYMFSSGFFPEGLIYIPKCGGFFFAIYSSRTGDMGISEATGG